MVKNRQYVQIVEKKFRDYTTTCSKHGVNPWLPEEDDALKQGVEEGKPPHAGKRTQFSTEDLALRSSFSAVNSLLKKTKALTEKPLLQVEDYDNLLRTIDTTMGNLHTGLHELGMDGSLRSGKSNEATGSETAIEGIRSLVQDETVVGLYSECFKSCSEITAPLETLRELCSRKHPSHHKVIRALDSIVPSIPDFRRVYSQLVAHRLSMASTTPATAGKTIDDSQLTETPEEADGSEDGASADAWLQGSDDEPLDDCKDYFDR